MGKLFPPLASALILILAFPPFGVAYLAWIGLVPLLVVLMRSGPFSSWGLGFLAGISFFMGIFSWINVIPGFTPVDFVLLGIYMGSYWGCFGLSLNIITRQGQISPVVAAPVLWVSLEYLRSHAGFMALPWALLGLSQYRMLPVIQMAAITGVYGLTFVIVMVNALMGEAYLAATAGSRTRSARPGSRLAPYALATLAVVSFSLYYGFRALSAPSPEKGIKVCVVQGNIPQAIKWQRTYRHMILERYRTLTRQAAEVDRPTLIVWPESAVPGPFIQDFRAANMICHLARSLQTPILLGSAQRPKLGNRDWVLTHRYNSVYLISPEGAITGYYHKIHLLPFAEYLPYRDSWPWPQRLINHAGDFIPGKRYKIFRLNGIKFAAVICWESIFPDLVRQFAARGAEFIVNVTNEAWFGDTAASQQIVMMNVFRAVENRLPIARATNTGISCVIDPQGRIIGTVTDHGKFLFVKGYLTKTLPRRQQTSFYTRHGEFFAYMNLFISGLLFLWVFFKKRFSMRIQYDGKTP